MITYKKKLINVQIAYSRQMGQEYNKYYAFGAERERERERESTGGITCTCTYRVSGKYLLVFFKVKHKDFKNI